MDASRLKPQHLRLILKISELEKLQLAADALAMSQPAASRMLGDIEAEVGAPLFVRHPKGMVPTQIGATFIENARVVLSGLDMMQADVMRLKQGTAGAVRIGTVTGPAVGSVVPAIHHAMQVSPGIEATVEVGTSIQLIRALEEGQLDFIIGRLPPDHDSRAFRIHAARSEVVALVVRADHPLANERDLHLNDLRNFNWVMQARGTPIRSAVELAFHMQGVAVPDVITNSSSLLVALATLDRSQAVSPQTKEVAALLTGPGINAALTILDMKTDIIVPPCFVIQRRYHHLTRAAQLVLDEVLRSL